MPPPPPISAIDWAAAAMLIADRLEAPCLVVDRQGRVRASNAAVERGLGWPRHELLGRPFGELFAVGYDPERLRLCLLEALRGTTDRCETTAVARDRSRVRISWDIASVGGAEGALVVTARDLAAAHDEPPHLPGESQYEIALGEGRFGEVTRVWGERENAADVGRRCYEAFGGRSDVCPGCPAVDLAQLPRTAVVARDDGPDRFRILTATPTGPGSAWVAAREVDAATLDGLLKARVDRLARRARLSPREGEVLRHLAAGRAMADIAQQMEIAPRTVKFHQGNVLAKLGADSRLDLLRLLL